MIGKRIFKKWQNLLRPPAFLKISERSDIKRAKGKSYQAMLTYLLLHHTSTTLPAYYRYNESHKSIMFSIIRAALENNNRGFLTTKFNQLKEKLSSSRFIKEGEHKNLVLKKILCRDVCAESYIPASCLNNYVALRYVYI